MFPRLFFILVLALISKTTGASPILGKGLVCVTFPELIKSEPVPPLEKTYQRMLKAPLAIFFIDNEKVPDLDKIALEKWKPAEKKDSLTKPVSIYAAIWDIKRVNDTVKAVPHWGNYDVRTNENFIFWQGKQYALNRTTLELLDINRKPVRKCDVFDDSVEFATQVEVKIFEAILEFNQKTSANKI